MTACNIIIKYLSLNKKYMKTERTFSAINIYSAWNVYRMEPNFIMRSIYPDRDIPP